MTHDDAYRLLGQLLAETPEALFGTDVLSLEQHRWLGRALAIAKPYLETGESIQLSVCARHLSGSQKRSNAQSISVLLHLALANAEIAASTPLRGMFLSAATPFDAYLQVGKVLSQANVEVLFVDPYSDEKLLDQFARQANEGVAVRVLAEVGKLKPTLKPSAERWVAQFQTLRPLEVRTAPAGSLHDRLMVVDGAEAWAIGQSFNGLATKSPSTILRIDLEPAKLKIDAMAALWAKSTSI
jgi:hypothetical protein